MNFYLGTHQTGWLSRTSVPLFVSRRRLALRKALPLAAGRWALDSGGFTEIAKFGQWETSANQYADEALRYLDEIGGLDWAAVQDWMCEPHMLAKTGKSVREHQELTVASWLELNSLAPSVPWTPVLQGWAPDDYLDHVEMYRSASVDLAAMPIVGVGSVCRRQATDEALDIFRGLWSLGLKLHGFGLKVEGLKRCARLLASSDSLAWSFRARRSPPLAGCDHASCANCMSYALLWRRKVLRIVRRPLPTYMSWS